MLWSICCPVVAFGGSSPLSQFGRQVFQEIDQVELMRGLLQICRPADQHQTHSAADQFCSAEGDDRVSPVRFTSIARRLALFKRSTRNLIDWSYAGTGRWWIRVRWAIHVRSRR